MYAIVRPGPAWLAGLFLLVPPVVVGQDGKEPERKPGTLRIKLPADALLEIDGKEIPGGVGKTERTFVTPPLEPGKRHAFVVKAIWKANKQSNITKMMRTRTGQVAAGETADVDLSKASLDQPDVFLIIYHATPMPVVEAMLEMAKVGKDDVVYDLGCGDGRMVVTAVSKYGAKRGVGVDVDPHWVEASRLAARKARVADRIEFREGDALRVKDLDKATVVCLYLGEELNEKLRPILRKALKPGSRVVSHRFGIGDWKPDEVRRVTADETPRQVYLWTVRKEDR